MTMSDSKHRERQDDMSKHCKRRKFKKKRTKDVIKKLNITDEEFEYYVCQIRALKSGGDDHVALRADTVDTVEDVGSGAPTGREDKDMSEKQKAQRRKERQERKERKRHEEEEREERRRKRAQNEEKLKYWEPTDHRPRVSKDLLVTGVTVRTNDSFTIYIDSLRSMPDYATILKVTGRILKAGVNNLPDITAYPDMDNHWRQPVFAYKQQYNTRHEKMNDNCLLFLRVYTVDIVSKSLCIIGSTLFQLYHKNELRLGGYQLRLRHGTPKSSGLSEMTAGDMQGNAIVPSATLLIRILPSSEMFIDAPDYLSGYYESEDCEPSLSECAVYHHYDQEHEPPHHGTIFDAAVALQTRLGEKKIHDDKEMKTWIAQKLDKKANGSPDQVPNMSLERFIYYKRERGMYVKIDRAHGLPAVSESMYLHCFTRILYEGDSEETILFSTTRHDYTGLQKAPIWLDPPTLIKPKYSKYACLQVEIWGIQAKYKPWEGGGLPGKATNIEGEDLTLDNVCLVAWTILPLFEGKSAYCGEHQLPLFKSKPTWEILDNLEDMTPMAFIREKKYGLRHDCASLVIKVWDGRLHPDEAPALAERRDVLEIFNTEKYDRAVFSTRSAPYSDLVVSSLPHKESLLGVKSSVYEQERQFFEGVMSNILIQLVTNKKEEIRKEEEEAYDDSEDDDDGNDGDTGAAPPNLIPAHTSAGIPTTVH